MATAGLLLAMGLPAQAREESANRQQDNLACALIQQIGAPIERKAIRSFSKRWPRIGEYQGYPVYQSTPEQALNVIMVLGSQDRKLLSEAKAGKAYLIRHQINAASIRRALQLTAQQALPEKVECDLRVLEFHGEQQLESLTFSQFID
eukprot:gene11051-10853_t